MGLRIWACNAIFCAAWLDMEKTAGQIIDAIGAQVLADTFDVTHSAIRKRRELNEFPAQWYHRMEVMGIERGITIPRYLFSFKGMAK